MGKLSKAVVGGTGRGPQALQARAAAGATSRVQRQREAGARPRAVGGRHAGAAAVGGRHSGCRRQAWQAGKAAAAVGGWGDGGGGREGLQTVRKKVGMRARKNRNEGVCCVISGNGG